jgi:uncharacterized protein (TIGR00290 family)
MPISNKYYLNWSGGKDSSLCLHAAQNAGMKIEALLTSINSFHDRISMHGVRRSLLEQQAASLRLPLYTIELPEEPAMEEYEKAMRKTCSLLKEVGFTDAVFGDIFLEDLKLYRETQLAKLDLCGVFPLWKQNTRELIREFVESGFKAIIVCVNSAYLDKSFCGRLIDASFLEDLPSNVDPCGENGEYHSFVFEGPIFCNPIEYNLGEIVFKEYKAPAQDDCITQSPLQTSGFYFQDILPASV